MTDKLLPCPFCGGTKQRVDFDDCNNFTVYCDCGAAITPENNTEPEAVRAWNTRAATQTTREFVDRIVRHQRLLKAKHWARSGWDGVPPEEVEEYKATYAAFTKVISYIQSWDERMNK